ncbi:MAG TPA: hypothetical protein PLL53_03260, partial [Saprospiraceae bacterium]|nr:hypothetical protein [Saprospiraceae bacterium]
VNSFDDVAKDTLDEWIYYLKNNRLPDHFTAPGLEKAEKILNYYDMNAEAKALYDAHIKARRISYDVLETARMEGREEGEHLGLEKKTIGVVVNAYKQGIAIPVIALIAAVSEEEVTRILGEQRLV